MDVVFGLVYVLADLQVCILFSNCLKIILAIAHCLLKVSLQTNERAVERTKEREGTTNLRLKTYKCLESFNERFTNQNKSAMYQS